MKTITINLYSFDELTPEAQKKAINDLSDINFNGLDWWDTIEEDAERVGLIITSFDIDRGSFVRADFKNDADDTATLIMQEHGETCTTYKASKEFLIQLEAFHTLEDGDKENDYGTEIEELEREYLDSLCAEYLTMLRNDYEYKISDEAIIETIQANEYTFEADGTLNNG